MKCEDLLKALNEYIDGGGEIDPALCDEFQHHLAGCNPCQIVVDNVRKTITLYKEGQPFEIPIPFRTKLHDCLRQKWQDKFRRAD